MNNTLGRIATEKMMACPCCGQTLSISLDTHIRMIEQELKLPKGILWAFLRMAEYELKDR